MKQDLLARESILAAQEVNTLWPAGQRVGIFLLGCARLVVSEVDTRDSLLMESILIGLRVEVRNSLARKSELAGLEVEIRWPGSQGSRYQRFDRKKVDSRDLLFRKSILED